MCKINMGEKSVDEKNNDEPTSGRFLGLLNIYKWTPKVDENASKCDFEIGLRQFTSPPAII